MDGPEASARQEIDRLLTAAGWIVQSRDEFDRNAGPGVAVREFQLPGGPADYLLFVAGRACGTLEAKKRGHSLSGVEEQSDGYAHDLPAHLAAWASPLPFSYESTGIETFFCDRRDPDARSRRVLAFHRPETLHAWLQQPDTLRARLRHLPPLRPDNLRDCQIAAITGLERSLAGQHPRALLQMATGAGKTFTACNFAYRLIKHAGARRILFLVDRRSLGEQTLREFQQFKPSDDNRNFTSLYNAQLLAGNAIDPDAKVVITTIQRLYSMLRGEAEYDADAEEPSGFETQGWRAAPERAVSYNSTLPIESFDFVVTDECHRSIYKLWRQVLEYFDAFLIGLTATPSAQTLGFFDRNLATEYPYERSVVDGVNVDYQVFRIRTEVGERGGTVRAGSDLSFRDRRTRRVRWQELDADLDYAPDQLDRSVTVPDQIRTVLRTYKECLFAELFPGRTWVPKTLIFARDDHHAEEIVRLAREVFEKGNEFCKKITYRTTGDRPSELIRRFRIDPEFRIAVTVDMIATGTDIRPLEVVMFMRDVRSAIYYEQMKGRGVRSIDPSDLKAVTPDAKAKTHFVLIDAVGVTETVKSDTRPLERKRHLGFAQLLERVAQGDRDADTLSTLAGRLARLQAQANPEEAKQVAQLSGGRDLHLLSAALLGAVDPDAVQTAAAARFGPAPDEAQMEETAAALKDEACRPFDSPSLRRALNDIKARSEIAIDETTADRATHAGFDIARAREMTGHFRDFIAANRDRLAALQFIFAQGYARRRLTYDAIRDLHDALAANRPPLAPALLWRSYERLNAAKVRKVQDPEKLLTNIVALVRFAAGLDEELAPFDARVEQRFNLWIGRQINAGRTFTGAQMGWLRAIRDHLAANAEIAPADFQDIPALAERGGILRARAEFGGGFDALLDDMAGALVA